MGLKMGNGSEGSSSTGEGKKWLPDEVVAPPPPPPAPQVHINAAYTPAEVYNCLVAAGVAKSKHPVWKLVWMGLMAGFYVSLGFTFCCCAIGLMGNTMYGALAFPTGLFLIILCGAELFTGNTCYLLCSWIERKTTLWDWLRVCTIVWFANLAGSLIIVEMEKAADTWHDREDWVNKIALKKLSLSWKVVVVRGIFANWLVNLAVYQATAARDVVGKAVGCWTPITCFVAIGFEHCIANQWILPMSIITGSGTNVGKIVGSNLVPATIGNIIGGAIYVGFMYAVVYGKTIPDVLEKGNNAMNAFFDNIWIKMGIKKAPQPAEGELSLPQHGNHA